MSFSNLPSDIQVQIFMKLTVSSILACKFLCKHWFSLLSNPKFVKAHLHQTRKSKHRLMLSRCRSRPDGESNRPEIGSLDYDSSILPLSLSSEYECDWDAAVVDYPIYLFRCENVKNLRILGSCDGLICLGIVAGSCNAYNIYIWNPSTKESNLLPYIQDGFSINLASFRYGFGYDKDTDDYKVVRIPCGYRDACANLQVYTLGSDSWHDVQTIAYSLHWQEENLLFFNGALHWLGKTKQGTSSDSFIFSFELSNETVVLFPFPEENHLKGWEKKENRYRSVGVLGDCLCLSFGYTRHIDVWVMQDYGVGESWTKRYTIAKSDFKFSLPNRILNFRLVGQFGLSKMVRFYWMVAMI